MNILLFGANGQLGTELRKLWPAAQLLAVRRAECDLRDPESIRKLIRTTDPELILNAAAYTAVDRAESEVNECFAINASAPALMAEEAAKAGCWLVHFSTDYVFDGEKNGRYNEDDPVNPLNRYGESKLAGERAIQSSSAQYVIFRTSWVFSPHGGNFVKTMLRLGKEREHLRIVGDQIGAPTSAKAVADATRRVWQQGPTPGLYHMTAAGEVSWAEFAKEIFRQAGLERTPVVDAISSAEYPTPARRPKNSRLANEKFEAEFGFRLTDWREQLRDTLSALLPGKDPNSVKENGHRS